MENLAELIMNSQDQLFERVTFYADNRGYSEVSSKIADTTRLAIKGLSKALVEMLEVTKEPPELNPGEDYRKGPAGDFAVVEAKMQCERGVSLPTFMGLMKYYRQAFIDVVRMAGLPEGRRQQYVKYLLRFFDRVELAFCTAWLDFGDRIARPEPAERRKIIGE